MHDANNYYKQSLENCQLIRRPKTYNQYINNQNWNKFYKIGIKLGQIKEMKTYQEL